MRIRWKGFELPTQVLPEESTRSATYGKFIVEPFERGYGITVGNSLRRILLSSMEGVAPVYLRINGVNGDKTFSADHEFASISGVYEDVVNIALNVKEIRLTFESDEPQILKISKKGKGKVVAGDLTGSCPSLKIANPDHLLCEIVKSDVVFNAEIEFRKGRGFIRSEDFTWETPKEIGIIPLDASFSPILRARWRVEETRVGKMTNYDKLILEIWTDGTIKPEEALVESAIILRKHLNPFIKSGELGEEFERESPAEVTPEVVDDTELSASKVPANVLDQSVSVLDPSVRAANCLASEGIKTIRELVRHTEQDMLHVRNFGKTSMKEIKAKLIERGLSFGMPI